LFEDSTVETWRQRNRVKLACGRCWQRPHCHTTNCTPKIGIATILLAGMAADNLLAARFPAEKPFADKGRRSVTAGFPRGFHFLADQLNRAALSIATNLAEGNGRFTKADRKNFFVIARGSVQECVPLLDLACRKGLVKEDGHTAFRNQIETIAKMIGGLINGLANRQV